MPKRTQDYHSWLIKRLGDPREAERYLKVAMEDSPQMFLKALRNVAEAKRMARVAEEVGVNRESLYRALSEQGNPAFFTIEAILDFLGMTLTPQLKQPVPSEPTLSTQTGEQAGQSGGNISITVPTGVEKIALFTVSNTITSGQTIYTPTAQIKWLYSDVPFGAMTDELETQQMAAGE